MSSTRKIRIGAVSYLNTKPLVDGLDQAAPQAELVYDLPSRLADALRDGRLDVALIPSIEYFRGPGYEIVSDACIACRGPVLSVKLLSRRPMSEIRSLALDEGSRTSVALVRILLQRRLGVAPRLEPLPIGVDARRVPADAVLLIGDRAIRPPEDAWVDAWDLGDQWCRWTGLPFVFAMWTARRGVAGDELAGQLAAARDRGLARLEAIAAEHAAAAGLGADECLRYFRENLHFRLGGRERQGLELFEHYTAEMSAVAT